MKRLLILSLSLLLLAGCGRVQSPEKPITEATTLITTTEEAATELIIPDAKPFTKDDITAIEANFNTVGDYVEAVPAKWYKVDHWDAYGSEIFIHFFDHKPKEDSQSFLYLQTRDETPFNKLESISDKPARELSKILLDAQNVKIRSINFAKTGSAITPPRGIKIGDPAQKIFEAYPDYRTGDSNVLYDITTLYPEANPAWGKWDGEGWTNIDFLGGGVMENGVGFTFVEQPWDWANRDSDYTWLNMYNPRYLLTYQTEHDFVTGINYRLLYHPG